MTLLIEFAAFGGGLWIIPVLTFLAGVFFLRKGILEQKKFKSKDRNGNIAPFWQYAPSVAGFILLAATAIIIIAVLSEW